MQKHKIIAVITIGVRTTISIFKSVLWQSIIKLEHCTLVRRKKLPALATKVVVEKIYIKLQNS